MDTAKFTEKLLEACAERGLVHPDGHRYAGQINVYALARLMNEETPDTSERSIRMWLTGEHLPSAANREALAHALGKPPGFFADGGSRLNAESYCFAVTGLSISEAGPDLVERLRQDARHSLRRAREIKERIA